MRALIWCPGDEVSRVHMEMNGFRSPAREHLPDGYPSDGTRSIKSTWTQMSLNGVTQTIGPARWCAEPRTPPRKQMMSASS
jgi:hypothetical protein